MASRLSAGRPLVARRRFSIGLLTGLMGLGATLAGVSLAIADVRVKVSERYYTVSGVNGEALFASMAKSGYESIQLRHAVAATVTDLDFEEPKVVVRNGRCVVESVDVTLKIDYIFPQWANRASASQETRQRWDEFYSELRRHEYNHGTIAKAGAEAFAKELGKLSGTAAVGCADFGSFARIRLGSVLKRTERAQQAFDRREYASGSRISQLRKALYRAR